MLGYLKKFERVLVGVLILMLALVVLLSAVELGRVLLRDMLTPPRFVLEIGQLLAIFGLFLLVLIGIKLLEALKKCSTDGCVDVDVILSIALIALARKIITLDPKEYDPLTHDRHGGHHPVVGDCVLGGEEKQAEPCHT